MANHVVLTYLIIDHSRMRREAPPLLARNPHSSIVEIYTGATNSLSCGLFSPVYSPRIYTVIEVSRRTGYLIFVYSANRDKTFPGCSLCFRYSSLALLTPVARSWRIRVVLSLDVKLAARARMSEFMTFFMLSTNEVTRVSNSQNVMYPTELSETSKVLLHCRTLCKN